MTPETTCHDRKISRNLTNIRSETKTLSFYYGFNYRKISKTTLNQRMFKGILALSGSRPLVHSTHIDTNLKVTKKRELSEKIKGIKIKDRENTKGRTSLEESHVNSLCLVSTETTRHWDESLASESRLTGISCPAGRPVGTV